MSASKFGLWMALALILVPLAGAQSYTVTDIGALPGGTYALPTGINDHGAVVGYANVSGGEYHAFLWTRSHGIQDLGTLSGDTASFGQGINNSGDIVGYNLNINAFLWTTTGGLQDLGTLGGSISEALAINDSSEVVGYSSLQRVDTEDAFLWTQTGGMQDINAIGGNTSSLAYSINGLNQVAGSVFSSSGVPSNAFIWTQSRGVKILGAGSSSAALGINATGEVVGVTGSEPPNAFLWTSRLGVQNLNALILPNSGWVLNRASANGSGQIVASGTINGESHAALLTPTN
jgi:probable HAF family extracellular repeat protein